MHVALSEAFGSIADDAADEHDFAEALWEEAAQAGRMGDAEAEAVLRDLSRRHRVGALLLCARVAAMRVLLRTSPTR